MTTASARSGATQKNIYRLLDRRIPLVITDRHAQHGTQLKLPLDHINKLKRSQFRVVDLQYPLLHLCTQVARELFIDALGALSIEQLLDLLTLAAAVRGNQAVKADCFR